MMFRQGLVANVVSLLKQSPYKVAFLTFASIAAVLFLMHDILLGSTAVEMRLILMVVCALGLKHGLFECKADEHDRNNVSSFSLKHGVFGYKPDEYDSNKVFPASGRAGMHDEKDKLSASLKHHAESGNLKEMTKTLEQIEHRCRPLLDMVDYNCVILHHAKGGDPSEAFRWLRRAISLGLRPKQGGFNSVMSSYAKTGNIEQALKVADDMKSLGLPFTTTTYTVFVDAWARAGDAGQAQAWMKQMLADKIQPNVVSFASVLRACASAGLLEDLDLWFKQSQKFGIQLNLITFDGMVRALARRPDAVNAVKWLEVMIGYGVKPDIKLCYEVHAAIIDTGDAELAAKLSELMRGAKVEFASARCLGQPAPKLKTGIFGTKIGDPKEWELQDGATLGPATAAAMQNGRAAGDQCEDTHAGGGGGGMAKAPMETVRETRKAVSGITFSGIIRSFKPNQFGFISCAATEKIFHRDVFLSCAENTGLLSVGQRVSFRVRVDWPSGLPRAYEVRPYPRASEFDFLRAGPSSQSQCTERRRA